MTKSRKYSKRGGFWNEASQTGTKVISSLGDTADKAGTGIQDFFSSGYNKIFKKNPSSTTNYSNMDTHTGFSNMGSITGGRRRRKRRGGTRGYTSLTNIASTASPVRGMYTAKAHNWVGGKTRRRRSKKRSHRRH